MTGIRSRSGGAGRSGSTAGPVAAAAVGATAGAAGLDKAWSVEGCGGRTSRSAPLTSSAPVNKVQATSLTEGTYEGEEARV